MSTEDVSIQGFQDLAGLLKATPEGAQMINILRRSGLWSDSLSGDKARTFRTSIAGITSAELGDEMAYWQSVRSSVTAYLGVVEEETYLLDQSLKSLEHKVAAEIYRGAEDSGEDGDSKPQKPPSATAIKHFVAVDERVMELDSKRTRIKRVEIVLRAIERSIEGYVTQVLSREITRRGNEMKDYR